METRCTYHGLSLMFPIKEIEGLLKKCAHELEERVPDLQQANFSVHPNDWNQRLYDLDLKVKSPQGEIVSSVETQDILKGIQVLKEETLKRLREVKTVNFK